VEADTRKLDSTEAFLNSLTEDVPESRGGGFGGGRRSSLKRFAEERRAYLLNHAGVKAASLPR